MCVVSHGYGMLGGARMEVADDMHAGDAGANRKYVVILR